MEFSFFDGSGGGFSANSGWTKLICGRKKPMGVARRVSYDFLPKVARRRRWRGQRMGWFAAVNRSGGMVDASGRVREK
jgi:hypothetical protein